MKRGVIVASATAVGLIGVLSFHTSSAKLTLTTIPATAVGPTTTQVGGGRKGAPSSTTTSPSTTAAPSAPAGPPVTTTTAGSAPRTAVGAQVNYSYGILAVSVSVSGKRITNVTIASIDDGGNFRSQSIDQQSIPILEREAISAQSANIQGVSGASYTSAGFTQSLQSALSRLGL
jgi:uncharacterized protein with FMN-binding domain